MDKISDVVINYLDKALDHRNLTLCEIGGGKYLAAKVVGGSYEPRYAFEIDFANEGFFCSVLRVDAGEPAFIRSFNVPWLNGKSIREFFQYIESLP